MFFHVQLPFSDLRSFIPEDYSRVSRPSWPTPLAEEEFVRHFGGVRERPRGGIGGWASEGTYCQAMRALRFPQKSLDSTQSIFAGPVVVAFRRLFFDGFATGKTEVGLNAILPPELELSIELIVSHIASLSVSVRGASSSPNYYGPLLQSARALADLYAESTRILRGSRNPPKSHPNVFPERPAIFIEVSRAEAPLVKLPKHARPVQLDQDGKGLTLYFWRIVDGSKSAWVWLAVANSQSDILFFRFLRLYLLRLNAEHQSIKRVLQAVGTGRIATAPRSDTAQALQEYLNLAIRRIGKCEGAAAAFAGEATLWKCFDVAAGGERDSIIERLKLIDVRTNIMRKVERYVNKQQFYIGMLNMTNSFGDTITVNNSTNVAIKSILSNAEQTVSGANWQSEDKVELQKLIAELGELLSKVPSDHTESAEAVAAQAGQLVDAAAKAKPNGKLLAILSNGLRQATSFLKDTAPTALTIVEQLIKLAAKLGGVVG